MRQTTHDAATVADESGLFVGSVGEEVIDPRGSVRLGLGVFSHLLITFEQLSL